VTRGTSCVAIFAAACSMIALQLWAAQPLGLTPSVQANYMLNCMGCHLPDGSGAAGKVPSMRDSLAILSRSSAGRRYLVQVPGASQSPLTNLELAQVLSWMVRNLSARAVPPDFADFTAAEVAGYRRSPLVSVRETRARLLQAAAEGAAP
jgi:mono/diheme cytochrome c family protein